MPRGANRVRKNKEIGTDNVSVFITEETEDVTTTETDTPELPFQLNISPLPEGYKPDRSPAGRTRTPSVFDDVLLGLKGKGWQKQPHDGNIQLDEDGKPTAESVKASNAHVIKRELQKAQHHLRLGMDIQITTTDVEFNVRDLQKRKAKEGETADAEGNVVDEADRPDENDVAVDEPAEY